MNCFDSTAIAAFVKTPRLSPIKTRLGATIGTAAAEEFYLMSLKAISQTIQAANCAAYWAVGEEDGLKNKLWKSFNCLHTGEGGLGERQDNVYRALLKTHNKVLLIGADSPQLTPAILTNAFEELEKSDFVIGPAKDGGYYLFGGKSPVATEVWVTVTYSTSETRAELIRKLPSVPAMLPILTDVDTLDDLKSILNELPDKPSTAQKDLARWIIELSGE